MPRLKGETLSIRTSPDIKELLRLAANREHRSVASMVEILVLEYARKHNLQSGRMSDHPEAFDEEKITWKTLKELNAALVTKGVVPYVCV